MTAADTPGNAAAFVQLEVTTACNFRCFYCAGRHMPQRHMERTVFNAILASLPDRPCTVSLQGEGEPTRHPGFIAMARQVAAAGHVPYSITNCSDIDPEVIAELFPHIGVSLDTVDSGEAERIGRFGLHRVLAHFEELLRVMGPERIVVHTVEYGQPLEALRAFLRRGRGIRHVVQPLQTKDDYCRHYSGVSGVHDGPAYHFACRYVRRPLMRYFDVTGREMPCCYIKDAAPFVSGEHIRNSLREGTVPACCSGCREITAGR